MTQWLSHTVWHTVTCVCHTVTHVLISMFLHLSFTFPLSTESREYSSQKYSLFSQGHTIIIVNPGLLGLTLPFPWSCVNWAGDLTSLSLIFFFPVCKPGVNTPTWQHHCEDWLCHYYYDYIFIKPYFRTGYVLNTLWALSDLILAATCSVDISGYGMITTKMGWSPGWDTVFWLDVFGQLRHPSKPQMIHFFKQNNSIYSIWFCVTQIRKWI